MDIISCKEYSPIYAITTKFYSKKYCHSKNVNTFVERLGAFIGDPAF